MEWPSPPKLEDESPLGLYFVELAVRIENRYINPLIHPCTFDENRIALVGGGPIDLVHMWNTHACIID
jgi:hypothetical protein